MCCPKTQRRRTRKPSEGRDRRLVHHQVTSHPPLREEPPCETFFFFVCPLQNKIGSRARGKGEKNSSLGVVYSTSWEPSLLVSFPFLTLSHSLLSSVCLSSHVGKQARGYPPGVRRARKEEVLLSPGLSPHPGVRESVGGELRKLSPPFLEGTLAVRKSGEIPFLTRGRKHI